VAKHSGEAQTCPRRLGEVGPWEYKENLDTWETVGSDRVCSFCGSLHPADFEAALRRVVTDEQCSIMLSDKGYKVYINRPEVHNASEGAIKYYKQHNYVDPADIERIEPLYVEAVKLSLKRSYHP
jgi:hypothetical protein